MGRTYDHNASIVYVDPKGARHSAIVTSWWGAEGASYDGPVFGNPPDAHASKEAPGVNLVYVEDDAMKKDPYGRQISRATSIVHKSRQPAGGNFWCWPDEV